jgi:hypothetical protein
MSPEMQKAKLAKLVDIEGYGDLLNRGTTRKRIRISRRFRRSLDYVPASGRPMRLGLPAGHRRPTNPI